MRRTLETAGGTSEVHYGDKVINQLGFCPGRQTYIGEKDGAEVPGYSGSLTQQKLMVKFRNVRYQ